MEDVNDMSVALKFVQDMMERKQMIAAAQEEKDQPLTFTESRDQLWLRHMTGRENTLSQDHQLRSAFVPPAYPPCTVPFSDLTKIMLKDLRLETHHTDRYLILRCIAPPSQLMSVLSVVEDECGDAIMLTLRHQDESRSRDDILGEGRILALKEPYLRRMADGTYGIIVDHLSNYKYLSMRDSLMPEPWKELWQEVFPGSQDNAKIWGALGNHLFEEEMYFPAVER